MAAKLFKVVKDEQRIKLAQVSLYNYVYLYQHHHLKLEIPQYQKEDFYSLYEIQKEFPLRFLDLEPRGYTKSKRFSEFLPEWLTIFCPYGAPWDVLSISHTSTKSYEWGRNIASEIETNPMIRADFPQLKFEKNNEEMKLLSNGSRWQGMGQQGEIRGWHPKSGCNGIVICDDIEKREDMDNPNLREKLRKWFFMDMMGTLDTPGTSAALAMVGTVVNEQSVLHEQYKDQSEGTANWIKIKHDAEVGKNGDVLWPEHKDREALRQLQAALMAGGQSPAFYMQEYRNMPIALETVAIRPDWIKYDDTIRRRWDLYCVTGVDYAAGDKEVNDWTAIVTVGVGLVGNNRGKIFVVDCERGHWPPSDAAKGVLAQYTKWGSSELRVETMGVGAGLYAEIEKEAQRRCVFVEGLKKVNPKKVKVRGEWVKADKTTRAQSVSPLFQEGRVHFRTVDKPLVDELLLIPHGDHDDMADACVLCLMSIKDGYMKRMNNRPMIKTSTEHVSEVAGY